jgi:hypothetical protein
VPQWRVNQPAASSALALNEKPPLAPDPRAGRADQKTTPASASLDPYLLAHRQMAGQGIMPAAHVYLRYPDGAEP